MGDHGAQADNGGILLRDIAAVEELPAAFVVVDDVEDGVALLEDAFERDDGEGRVIGEGPAPPSWFLLGLRRSGLGSLLLGGGFALHGDLRRLRRSWRKGGGGVKGQRLPPPLRPHSGVLLSTSPVGDEGGGAGVEAP